VEFNISGSFGLRGVARAKPVLRRRNAVKAHCDGVGQLGQRPRDCEGLHTAGGRSFGGLPEGTTPSDSAANVEPGMHIESKLPQGGLAPWQLRRAKEILSAHIVGSISIAHLAAECGLSTCHFARSFRHSTGISPHRWLMHRRVDRATELLKQSRLSIIDIALSCGFADQSHLTRVFTSVHGSAPGRWRRAAKSDRPPASF
jgi:AraC-like DNA-binding protein